MSKHLTPILILLLTVLTFQSHAQSAYPKWLLKLYPTDTTTLSAQTKSNFPDIYAPKAMKVIFFKQLSDSISYCIYIADNGVCKLYFLATQHNRKQLTNEQIADNCQADISSLQYVTSSYQLDSATNIIISKHLSETAMDNYVTNDGQLKRFKPGYNRRNAVMLRDSSFKQIAITDKGLLEESRLQKK